MKKIIALFLVFSIFACNSKEGKEIENDTNYPDFDWLLGNWIRSNEKEDRKTYENWTKVNAKEYAGVSFTIKDNDTIWQENVMITEHAGNWHFVVTPKGETQQTIFKLTKLESTAFTCENHRNEFPQVIRYFKEGNKLKAEIEGGETKIPFVFEKNAKK